VLFSVFLRAEVYCRWSKKENHYITSELLTLIEDSAVYKVAFGFHKGDAGVVNSGGKKSKDHHLAIAQRLFIDSAEFEWEADDLPQLSNVVKNRINVYVPH
jgi:hypothetical protein